MNEARNYITQMLDIHHRWDDEGVKIFGNPMPVYEFIDKHGLEFAGAPKPERYVWRMQGRCFENSWRLALRSPRLTYVEGYATTGLIPVHHAWCIDEIGQVVDVTWKPNRMSDEYQDPSTWSYFGVPINVEPLKSWMRRKMTLSVIFDLQYHAEFLAEGLTVDEIVAKVAA